MPIESSVLLSDALFITAIGLPMAVATFVLSLYWRQLRALPTTRWVAPIACFLAIAITILAWILYAISYLRATA